MSRKKILCIGGTLNQTTIVHEVSRHLQADYDCYFTPFYADGLLRWLAENGMLNFTLMGGEHKQKTVAMLQEQNLTIDERGEAHDYDLVIMATDTIVPKNILGKKIILVQEGMMTPENLVYHTVKKLGLPRFIGNTSLTGLSDTYVKFCVASEGFKQLFANKGVNPDKIEVTGIPNFDNLERFRNNDFPHHDFVLGATSCLRETFQYENRRKFIEQVVTVANGRPIIFKLHPNENIQRATQEIEQYAPGAIVVPTGDIRPIIANCSAMVTKYSSVIMTALGLGKKVYSDFAEEDIKMFTPLQNGGTSAKNIADICRYYLEETAEHEKTQGE